MKKTGAVLLLALLTALPLAAAEPASDGKAAEGKPEGQSAAGFRDDLQQIETEVISKAVSLTTDEATRFWPLFKQFQDEHPAPGVHQRFGRPRGDRLRVHRDEVVLHPARFVGSISELQQVLIGVSEKLRDGLRIGCLRVRSLTLTPGRDERGERDGGGSKSLNGHSARS